MIESSRFMEMDSSYPPVEVWTCRTCNDVFPGSAIVRHFVVHPPSEYPGAFPVGEDIKTKILTLAPELFRGDSLKETPKLKIKASTAELTPPTLKESPVTLSRPGAVEPSVTPRKAPAKSDSSVCSSDSAFKTAESSPILDTSRRVAKKSCSGRKPKKEKDKRKKRESASAPEKPKAIAKKSCSGLKRPHGADKPKKPKTDENSDSNKHHSHHRQREISPEKSPKREVKQAKKRKSEVKAVLHEIKPKKAKAVGKKPRKTFKKPPLIRSNPNQTSEVLLRAKERMNDIMKRPVPSIPELMQVMLEAFPYRRYLYENESPTGIKPVFDEYPALHVREILKRDFELFKRANIDELNWKLSKVLEVTYERSKSKYYMWPDPLLQSATEKYRISPSEELLMDMKMMCLAFDRMNGKTEGVLYKLREKGGRRFAGWTPTIDIQGDYGKEPMEITVFCEKMEVTKAPNFYEAVLSVYSLYWIFNLSYEKGCQPFFETFDDLIGER